ncbi:vegetative cell wall protein gp1 [Arachis ipaensis]|uniref:vegetative cell wall protein gp1 n=1 Tax=Arachis ipaensis TaxID=130454 RepID=UPI0007AF3CA9|nr:vegetative cell wall protein gp1 [Arachis ipaensis]
MVARVVALVLGMLMVTSAPSYAQISTPCNVSALSTVFTPCAGFLTNSSGNGTSPTAQCCGALKSITSGGMNCLFQCKASGTPLPAPGPVAFGPSPSSPSGFTPTPSPQASSSSDIPPSPSNPPSLAPESDTTSSSPLQSPASPSVDSGTTSTPASSTESSRPGLTPSYAIKPFNAPPSLLFIALGVAVLKFY